MHLSIRSLAVFGAILAVIGLAACGDDPEVASDIGGFPLSSARYESAEVNADLTFALESQVATCMRHAGFADYPLLPIVESLVTDHYEFPFGLSDPEQAARYRYHPTAEELEYNRLTELQGVEMDALVDSLSEAETKAFWLTLFGDQPDRATIETADSLVISYPMEGCRATAETAIYGDRDRFIALKAELDILIREAAVPGGRGLSDHRR